MEVEVAATKAEAEKGKAIAEAEKTVKMPIMGIEDVHQWQKVPELNVDPAESEVGRERSAEGGPTALAADLAVADMAADVTMVREDNKTRGATRKNNLKQLP